MGEKAVSGKKKRNIESTGYFFVAPFVIAFIIFSVYPVLRTFYLSFTDYKGFGEAALTGGVNYLRVLQAVRNSFGTDDHLQ